MLRSLALAALPLLAAGVASATTIPATPASFMTAWLAVKPGDTLALAPGIYPSLSPKGRTFSPGITVTSADPTRRAQFTTLNLIYTQGVVFSRLEFVASPTRWAVLTQKSAHIVFDHVYVHGSLDGDASNDAGGLGFLSTDDVTVSNSEFAQLRQAISDGANVGGSDDKALIVGNTIHGVMKSGMVFAGVSDVEIAGNTISDVRIVPPDHPDCIQFFTTGMTTPAHDIYVHDNLLLRGPGDASQGIFLRDQAEKLHYQRVRIDNNLIVGTGYGGIAIDGIVGLELLGNELISFPGKTNNTWLLVQNASAVTAAANIAQTISFDATDIGVTQSGNSLNLPVTDNGLEAITRWLAARMYAQPPAH